MGVKRSTDAAPASAKSTQISAAEFPAAQAQTKASIILAGQQQKRKVVISLIS